MQDIGIISGILEGEEGGYRIMQNFATIVLAAGKGTRMKSKLTKVLHPILGKPMLHYILSTVKELKPARNIVVIGHQADKVREAFKDDSITFTLQKEQLGTGHAVKIAGEQLQDFTGNVLILYGDTPLLTVETLQEFIEFHQEKKASASVLTARLPDPEGYGRVVRDDRGTIQSIIEEADLRPEEKDICEVNSGIYLFDTRLLLDALNRIQSNNAQGEYYLTDVVEIFRESGHYIYPFLLDDYTEILGVNDRVRLAEVTGIIQKRINKQWMEEGVTIIDPSRTYIHPDVEIERDVTIYPGVILEGNTKVGENTVIGPGCRIKDSRLGRTVNVQNSVILKSIVGDNCTIGPFAYLRPGTELETGVKIGDFVEVKKSRISEGAKVPHLSYIGDATIGSKTNIGAGTITANYDSQKKNPTTIGREVFIGSNCTLVAPVKVGDRAMTGAGSVVTRDVEEDTVVVGVPAKFFKRRKEEN